MADHHADAAQRIQEKFYFYLVGLAFTILGLSIKTSKFGVSMWADVFELLGWLSLLVSGIVGLLRLEWEPYLHEKFAAINLLEEDRKDFKDALVRGTPIVEVKGEGLVSVPDLLKQTQEKLDAINKMVEGDSRKSIRKYAVHRYCFVAGIIFFRARLAM